LDITVLWLKPYLQREQWQMLFHQTVFAEGAMANAFSSIINGNFLNRILNDDEFNGVIEAIQYIPKAIRRYVSDFKWIPCFRVCGL
jgi:hypothetical protein